MPGPSPYHVRLLQARRALDAGPRADVLRALAEHYADCLARVAASAGTGMLDADRASAIERALRGALRRLSDRLAGAIDREAQAAVELAVNAAWEAASGLVTTDDPGVLVRADFDAVPERALEGLFVRRGLPGSLTYAALTRRGAARAQPLFEQLVARALATGQTGEALTRDLAAALADVDPLVRQAARRATGEGGRLLKRALLREARLDPNPDVLVAARRLWYEARRVAVTEVNVAFAEADRAAAAVSPVVDLLRWRVSGRHDGLRTGPCSCDYYRVADLHGYGPGLYHPAAYPAHPHPHCACRAEHVLRPASEWDAPKRPLPTRVSGAGPADRDRAERERGRSFTEVEWARVSGAGGNRARVALQSAVVAQGDPAEETQVFPRSGGVLHVHASWKEQVRRAREGGHAQIVDELEREAEGARMLAREGGYVVRLDARLRTRRGGVADYSVGGVVADQKEVDAPPLRPKALLQRIRKDRGEGKEYQADVFVLRLHNKPDPEAYALNVVELLRWLRRDPARQIFLLHLYAPSSFVEALPPP